MNIFVFDNTFEGLLTSVFEAYSRRVFPDALFPEGEPLPLFHDEVFTVITEEEKAKRVWRGLQKKLSSGALSCLAQCWLAEEQETPMLLFRYIRKAIDAPRSIETNFADPDVLILDEPTAGLDVEARNEILDLLRDYAAEDENRTILITSHIASDLEHLCDDIYLIHGGKQLLHEETDVILEQYGLIKADEAQYAALDKEYLLGSRKEPYGYACLTNDRKYYEENVPGLVVERAGIDEVILMMTGGKRK